MKPRTSKIPSEKDWDVLRELQPCINPDEAEAICDFHSKYLVDSVEISQDLFSNLYSLWKFSKKHKAKISKKDAKAIEKLVLTAFSKTADEQTKSPRESATKTAGRRPFFPMFTKDFWTGELARSSNADKITKNIEKLDFLETGTRNKLGEKLCDKSHGVKLSEELVHQAFHSLYSSRSSFFEYVVPEILERVEKPKELAAWVHEVGGLGGENSTKFVMPWVVQHTPPSKNIKKELGNFHELNSQVLEQFSAFEHNYRTTIYVHPSEAADILFNDLVKAGKIQRVQDISEWGKRIADVSQLFYSSWYAGLSEKPSEIVSHVLANSTTPGDLDSWIGALSDLKNKFEERRHRDYGSNLKKLTGNAYSILEQSATPQALLDSFSKEVSVYDKLESDRIKYGISSDTQDKFSNWEHAKELIVQLEGHLKDGIDEKYEKFRESKGKDAGYFRPWAELAEVYNFETLVGGGLLGLSKNEKELELFVIHLLGEDPAQMAYNFAKTKRDGDTWNGGKSRYDDAKEVVAHCISTNIYFGIANKFEKYFPGRSRYGLSLHGEHPKIELIPAIENSKAGVLDAEAVLSGLLESYAAKKERYFAAIADSCEKSFGVKPPEDIETALKTILSNIPKEVGPDERAEISKFLASQRVKNQLGTELPKTTRGLIEFLQERIEFDFGSAFEDTLRSIPSTIRTRTKDEILETTRDLGGLLRGDNPIFFTSDLDKIFEKASQKSPTEVFDKISELSGVVLSALDENRKPLSSSAELFSCFLSSLDHDLFKFTKKACEDICKISASLSPYEFDEHLRFRYILRAILGPDHGDPYSNLSYFTSALEKNKLIDAIALAGLIENTGNQGLWGKIISKVSSTEFSEVQDKTKDLAKVLILEGKEGGWSPKFFIGRVFENREFDITELNTFGKSVYPLVLGVVTQEQKKQSALGYALENSLVNGWENRSLYLAFFSQALEEKKLIEALELVALFDSTKDPRLWHAIFSKVGSTKFSDIQEQTQEIAGFIKSGRSFNVGALTEAISNNSLQTVSRALDPSLEDKINTYPSKEKEQIRAIFNSLFSNTSGVTSKLNVKTIEEAQAVIEDTARVLAFTAFKTQSTLRRISEETKKPIVAAYILSTGFGLRSPTPSMRQFDNQYLDDPSLLEKAFSERLPSFTGKGGAEQKIKLLKHAFLAEVLKAQQKLLDSSEKEQKDNLELKAARMHAFLSVGSRWMENGWLKSLIYQTGYKVTSSAGKINPSSKEAAITDKIGGTAIPLGCPIVIVDHSTVRTSKHPTLANSQVSDSSMGRAIAQVISRLVETNPDTNDKVGWVSVINNWNIGETITQVGTPKIIGLNLYAGMEYRSIGGRKENWLPTDDKPFFVGRQWESATMSTSSKLTSLFMDENYKIVIFDSTDRYWGAFREKYLALESQNRMDWARRFDKIVLFDVDGTIVSSNGAFEPALKKSFQELSRMLLDAGTTVTPEELETKYQVARQKSKETLYDYGRFRDMEIRLYNLLLEVSPQISNESVIASLRSFAKAAYDIYWSERMKNTTVYPGAVDCLAKLNSSGHNVILMSDRRDTELHDLLQLEAKLPDGQTKKVGELVKGAIITNDLISEIQTDIPICRLGLPKENEAYSKVVRLLNPGSVELMVGDSRSHDIKPAEKSGIPGVLVKHGQGYEKVIGLLEKAA